ncbi:hypothetical protein [Roseateles amylovorans]|uniref:Uncharacterized protein n=1 Tax=Roseateles amylovorans TaxID=2978473 RepID=A0ABY6B5W1_9BURK|nr:hypothetical protein [Roseateles amylovorans]UXH80748.1 hypothetical protein N4261_13085 [Roseateles amylovorans]
MTRWIADLPDKGQGRDHAAATVTAPVTAPVTVELKLAAAMATAMAVTAPAPALTRGLAQDRCGVAPGWQAWRCRH